MTYEHYRLETKNILEEGEATSRSDSLRLGPTKTTSGHYLAHPASGQPRLMEYEHDGAMRRGWPFARNRDYAERLRAWFNNRIDGAAVAVQPAVSGVPFEPNSVESLMIEAAAVDGCRAMLIVDGWDDNGDPRWTVVPL